ncbi:class I SAM-dependent methyltransferase [Azospirillum tabaci]|uniref:class I SAM-dependent methyltransferase n=1 Tax=Azospirillum tabaci TaxID=2752310 RepID=UPI00166130B2|nr:class I SAM-dependent methyltransferase [Azospirillum tabaci]
MPQSVPELAGPEAVGDQPAAPAPRKTVLNVGSGPRTATVIGTAFPATEWQELRLDIDPAVDPDIVASMTDMPAVPDMSMDAVWSSHNLEHLDRHEVPRALREFLRVLRPGGQLLLAVPDLQAVARLVAADRTDEPLYRTDGRPIYPLDALYGYEPALAGGNRFMAHRTGFTPRTLGKALQDAGFESFAMWRWAEAYELQVKAYRSPAPAGALDGIVQNIPTT